MARRIQQRIAEVETFPNVFKEGIDFKGRWSTHFFKNDKPVIVELACGKGDYTIQLAQRYSDKNFIGVDIRSARLWKGAKTALEKNIQNVAFIVADIQNLCDFFDKEEVSEIWIPFPDPYPKNRHAKHRLTSPFFLALYRNVLNQDGVIHFKTDDDNLYQYSLETLMNHSAVIHKIIEDIHSEEKEDDVLKIQTTYEKKFLSMGRRIKYIRFSV